MPFEKTFEPGMFTKTGGDFPDIHTTARKKDKENRTYIYHRSDEHYTQHYHGRYQELTSRYISGITTNPKPILFSIHTAIKGRWKIDGLIDGGIEYAQLDNSL